jgi:RHS repeat-associated protein
MLDRLTGMDRGTLNEQKTAIAGTPAREESWNLNQTGNWTGYDVAENGAPVLNQTRTNNKANEITGIETPPEQTQWAEPEYDARGNMITVPKPNSPASAFTCTWDAWNRLIQVKDGETVVATYAYDGLNHRITKTVGETIRHAYYNADWQLLETRETTDPEAKPETLNPEFQFVWSVRYIDALVLRDENKNGDGDCTDPEDQRLFYLNDANMNVTALVNDSGMVLERYAYTPYGKPSFFDASWNPRAESAYDNSILYCGYFYDSETGLYHVRRRYYHPTLGRWLSRDPIGYVDGMSLHEYTTSWPVSATDALGTSKHGLKYDCMDSYAISRGHDIYALNAGSFDVMWTVPLDDDTCKWTDHGAVTSGTNRLSRIIVSISQPSTTFSGPSQEGLCNHVSVDVTITLSHNPFGAATLAAKMAGLWHWGLSLVWDEVNPTQSTEPDTIVYFSAELQVCCQPESAEKCKIDVIKNEVAFSYREGLNRYSPRQELILNPRPGSAADYSTQVTCNCEEF